LPLDGAKADLPAWRKALKAAKDAALAEMPPDELTEYEAASGLSTGARLPPSSPNGSSRSCSTA
jgi:hypothetical protein